MKRSKILKPEHCKRVRLKDTNKYGSLVEFICYKSLVKWDGTDRVIKVLNNKLDFIS
jgi:hypothetical protein